MSYRTAPPEPPKPFWKRSWFPFAVVAAVAIPVAVIGIAYLLFFTDDSPAPLALSTPTPRTTTSAGATGTPDSNGGPADLAGEWSVAGDSVAGYRVREKLARLPAQSDAVGRTSAITGFATLSASGSGWQVDTASFEVEVSQLQSDESRRDNRLRTDGLETDEFPTASFELTAPIDVPAAAADGSPIRVDAVGDLTVHGVTKNVTIPIDARLTGEQIELVGSITFPMADFEIDPPNIGGFVEVEDEATLEFQLFLAKTG
jgi:polyisoprenoid-binding protein YceI